MLRSPRERLRPASSSSPRGALCLALCALALACSSAPRSGGVRSAGETGSANRIEQRSLSERPPLAIIQRDGDPEAALGFASLAAGAPELHAELGQLLNERLTRAGFPTQLVAHGLGFELTVLAENPERARAALEALLGALRQPVAAAELSAWPPAAAASRSFASAVAQCSAELTGRARADAGQLERERLAAFARDRAALSIVGGAAAADAVVDALADGPDWPELGRVRSSLPQRSVTQILPGEHATLSVALTTADPNRALGAVERLSAAQSALGSRLAALGAGLRVRGVKATAHPAGACLRLDSDVDASPLPDPKRLGFAVRVMEEEARLALAEAPDRPRLEAGALAATDPRSAARAAAFHALLQPPRALATQRLVALTAADALPSAASIDAAIEQAREPAPLLPVTRVEAGQPGFWALLSIPCAASSERAESAGHAAVFVAAASAGAPRGVRLEPWVGASGVGLLAFTARASDESDAQAAVRLADALGHALLTAPSAVDIASARSELLGAAGSEPRPLFERLLEALAPGHVGALAPRGHQRSLQAASRDQVLARQRELLRLPARLAVISPGSAADAQLLGARLSRWLHGPDAPRPSPCGGDVGPPARGELNLASGSAESEPSYVAFRVSPKAAAEAALLSELLNLPGGALERALADPDLVGAARALSVGSGAARALVIQISAFDGREDEALERVQRLLGRLASGGALGGADIEAATARRRAALRLAALDPRYRLVQLLEPAPALPDTAALQRFASSLRPESAVVARGSSRTALPARKPAAR